MPPLHIALILLINLVWGVNFVAVEYAVRDFSPLVAVSLRFLIAGVFLFPFIRWVPGKMRDLLMTAFMLGVVHFGAVFIGMNLSGDVSSVAIASQLYTPFSVILAVIFLGERIGAPRITAIAISFAGVLVMGFDPKVFSYLDGLLWITVGTLAISVSSIFNSRLKGVNPFLIQGWVALAGVLGAGALSFVFETGQVESVTNAGWISWSGVIYSGILSTVVGHGGLSFLLSRYEVSRVSPYMVTMPVFAVIAGIVILDETLTWRMWLGGLLTIGGVCIVTLRNIQAAKRRKREAANALKASEGVA